MKTVIVQYPGTNRERDMIAALKLVTGTEPMLVWHKETELPHADLIVLPGGFSFGDYLRAGAIAARSPVMADLVKKAEAGVPVLGVCNGFQTLVEVGLLPGALMRNRDLKFICKDVFLRVDNADTRFTARYDKGAVLRCPVAHADGNYFADDDTLRRLEGEDRVVFRYCNADGQVDEAANPNGSQQNIAGILDARGSVLGMMPHPEDLVDPLQGGTDCRGLFDSLLDAA
ncbi:MAG: phosphoribosylformylglycinamidine synthase subunit PurQ [Pseudomonadota bacterium]